MGAALLAGLAVNFWTMEELIQQREIEKVFIPLMDEEKRKKLYTGWLKAIEKAKNWQQ